MMKSGFVAIIGRPSSGKSTLLNALCEEKVSITSPVPQTTRNKIRGIVHSDAGQIVFIDTPGFHHSERKFNKALTSQVMSSLQDAEAVLYLLDGTRHPGDEEKELAAMILASGRPVIVAVNKVDKKPKTLEEVRIFAVLTGFKTIMNISAEKNTGLEELKTALYALLPEGEPLYPEESYTDQEPAFRMAEIIREKAIARVTEEIPHAIFVEIEDMEKRDVDGKEKLWVRAVIIVERQSQVGIVVGRGGEGIKAIRQESQKDFKKVFTWDIYLDLRVKVNAKWRSDDRLIKKHFGAN
jgi:GTP-binding protein Era